MCQDIIFIKQSGFDHVRLPVDEEELWNIDFTKKTDAFLLTSCIAYYGYKNSL